MTFRLLSLASVFVLSAAPALAQVAGTPSSPPPTNAPATPAAAPAAPAAPAPAPTTSEPADTSASESATPGERPSTYTVVQGDSLWVIAHKFGTTVVRLRKANHLKKHALLHPGQVLKIPPATTESETK